MSAVFQPDIPLHIAEVIRHLPPDLKRSIKAAIRTLSQVPDSGTPLVRELDGFWKYRVRRFRIVYVVDRRRKLLKIVGVGHRRRIYEDVAAHLARRS
ncbi:MAG: type II toxin-antitoxin system RelE family toxin [bacterium]